MSTRLSAPPLAKLGMLCGFLVAGVGAGATAYSYARLGRMRPKDSPEFQYTAMAFGNRVGFIAGWLMLAADLLAAATVALGFGGYVAHLMEWPVVASALVLLLLTAMVLYAGVAESVGLAIVFTLVEVAGLLFIVVIGIPSWSTANYTEMPRGLSGVWSAAALIFFAYLGFDELGNFAEEMRQPQRDLPWAVIITMLVTTAIYMLVALSAIGTAGWELLSGSQAPLALVAGQALGRRAGTALSLMALVATANTVLLLLAAASRSVYGMATAGVLPAVLGQISGARIPARAAGVVIGIAASLVLLGNLSRVAELTNGAILASFMLVNLSLVWLARQVRDARFRLLDVAVPGVALLMCAWLFVHTGALALLVTFGLAAVGFVIARASGPSVKSSSGAQGASGTG